MNEEVIIGYGVREPEETNVGTESVVRVKGLESVLSWDSPPGDFPFGFGKEAKESQIVLKGKMESWGLGVEERKSKKEKTQKEPEEERDQSLESDLEGEGEMGEIMESKAERLSISESPIFLEGGGSN